MFKDASEILLENLNTLPTVTLLQLTSRYCFDDFFFESLKLPTMNELPWFENKEKKLSQKRMMVPSHAWRKTAWTELSTLNGNHFYMKVIKGRREVLDRKVNLSQGVYTHEDNVTQFRAWSVLQKQSRTQRLIWRFKGRKLPSQTIPPNGSSKVWRHEAEQEAKSPKSSLFWMQLSSTVS